MQKILIGIITDGNEASHTEHSVNNLLSDGWKIVNVYLTSFQPRNGFENNKAIFVLEKDDEQGTN